MKNKINGYIGIIRCVLLFIKFIIISIVGIPVILSCCIFLLVPVNFLLSCCIVFILINFIGTTYALITKQYYIRELTISEHQNIKFKNLIHYTDFIPEGELQNCGKTKFIKVHGNSKARANYSMTWKEAKEEYIWFHLSSKKEGKEPLLKSFLASHATQSTPRKYKIIIKVKDVDLNKIYIRPYDKAILVKGHYYGEGMLEPKFKWYNEKIYFKELCGNCHLEDTYLTIFITFKQLTGIFRDWLS